MSTQKSCIIAKSPLSTQSLVRPMIKWCTWCNRLFSSLFSNWLLIPIKLKCATSPFVRFKRSQVYSTTECTSSGLPIAEYKSVWCWKSFTVCSKGKRWFRLFRMPQIVCCEYGERVNAHALWWRFSTVPPASPAVCFWMMEHPQYEAISTSEHLTLKNTHKILYPTHRPQTKFNAVRSLSQHIRIYRFLPAVWIGFGCRYLAVKWSLEMTITCFSQIWLLPFKWTMNASSQLCTTDLSASSI